jgi:hypothetical protein
MTSHRQRIQRRSTPEARLAAIGLLPMLEQGRCDDLVRLVDPLSPIVR